MCAFSSNKFKLKQEINYSDIVILNFSRSLIVINYLYFFQDFNLMGTGKKGDFVNLYTYILC